MKHIWLMRHGKAEKSAARDFDRQLMERGRSDSVMMAGILGREEVRPQLILASAAVRTMQTAQLIQQTLDIRDFVSRERLYLCDTRIMLDEIRQLDAAVSSVLIVGHNPCMENMIGTLTGSPGLHAEVPTAGMAALVLYTSSWQKAGSSPAFLKWFLVPRLFRDEKAGS